MILLNCIDFQYDEEEVRSIEVKYTYVGETLKLNGAISISKQVYEDMTHKDIAEFIENEIRSNINSSEAELDAVGVNEF